MRQLAYALALSVALALPAAPAAAADESLLARQAAALAVDEAKQDMAKTSNRASLKTGQHLWAGEPSEVTRVVISLNDQMAFAYRGDDLIGVSTISSGRATVPVGSETATPVRAEP